MKTIRFKSILLATLVASSSLTPVQATLLNGWQDFSTIALSPNDDSSTGQIFFNQQGYLNFESGVNFFGNIYDSFYINNNGNISFNDSVRAYTPSEFPISSQPMIAPFWADVDTRCDTCGSVFIGSPNEDTLVITWDQVGYYSNQSDKTNTFQLVLIDRDDTGSEGDFDVEFRYENIEWTTGDASYGVNGLGGIPAQAGYDAGDQVNYFIVPGSRTDEIVDIDTAPSNTDTPGIWKWQIRDGALPGNTADNPLLPVIDPETPTKYQFDFVVTEPSQPIFIDPDVAIGYDYIVNSGQLITSVILPTGFGDNLYDLWLWDNFTTDWIDTGVDITGGQTHNFDGSGVDRFRILGIETDAMVDPTNPNAFVTGLTFDQGGTISMEQQAITTFIPDPVSVPEPSTFALFAFASLAFIRRRKLQ